MKILRHFEDHFFHRQRWVATIGNFDGVHVGHQALFKKTKEKAQILKAKSLGITFNPHPLKVLNPSVPLKLLCTLEEKIELIEKTGIEYLFILPFDSSWANMPPEIFIKEILLKRIGLKALIVGYDYRFGAQKKGDVELLKQWSQRNNFQVEVIPPVKIKDSIVSSSLIRNFINKGKVKEIFPFLGRPYSLRGKVIKGEGMGRAVLGFPTANLKVSPEKIIPPPGVYAVNIIWSQKKFSGLMNIGYRPTFDGKTLSLEVHILDFNQDLYGEKLKIEFLDRIREERKFTSPKELKKQIYKDIQRLKDIIIKYERTY